MSESAPIKNAIVKYVVTAILTAAPFSAHINFVADLCRRYFNWHHVVIAFSVLILVACVFFLKWLEALRKLKADFRTHLQVVENKGYEIDTRNGQAVCPRCKAEKNVEVPMMRVDGESPHFHCNACGHNIYDDGKSHRNRRKVYNQ